MTVGLRLLLIAPYCNRADVGEAWSTYQWVSRLAVEHDVTVLTLERGGQEPVARQVPKARVVAWQEVSALRRYERFNAGLKPSYVLFYLRARRWIKRALRSGETFDVAHQVSPLALRYPSPAAGLLQPLVVGPLGGSLATPLGFQSEFGTSPWFVRMRALDAWRFRWDPILRGTYRSADVILGVAPYVRDLLLNIGVRRFEWMSETGIDSLPEARAWRRRGPGELRLLFVGRLVRSKGARDAIRALALLQDLPGITLDLVGDGDDRETCEREVLERGLGSRVRFHGRLSRERVNEFYRIADAFLFPSFREPSGNVVFEAMSYGLPVITADAGGPGFVVDDTCGIRIRPGNPEQYARDLAGAVRRMASERDLVERLGEGARRRVADVALWEAKVLRVTSLYRELKEAEEERVQTRSNLSMPHEPLGNAT